jgi:DNA-binding IclR family transcriptional regulator
MADAPLNSVRNALQLLGLFTPEQRQLGLTDIARRLGLTKQSTLRLLATLEDGGFIERIPHQTKYRLGMRIWEIGRYAFQNRGLHERWRPILDRLAAESGFDVRVTAYSHGEVVNIDRAEGRQPLQVATDVGERLPAYVLAGGRPLLAYQPAEEIERVIGAGLRRYTDATITAPEALRAELARVRRNGIAVDRGEWSEYLWAVGAPVFDEHGAAAFAVAAIGLAAQVQQAPLERIVALVSEAARAMSRALGAPDCPPAPAPLAQDPAARPAAPVAGS